VTAEFVEQRLALFDYALKAQAMRLKDLESALRPGKDPPRSPG